MEERELMRGLAGYRRLLEARATLEREIAKARAKLAKACTHPEEFVTNYRWEHDNGYGRQSMHTGRICGICLKRDPWVTGNFYAAEQLTGDA